jgi:UDP-GlcNAc3NAcA epimerase
VVILRTETEWTDIVKAGCGIITGSDPDKINEAFEYFLNKESLTFPPVFGDGSAAEFICETIIRNIG